MAFITNDQAEQAITNNLDAFYSDPLVSNCCGAREKEGNDQDTPFCGECKERCIFISEFDYVTQGEADPVPDYVPEHGKTWYLIGRTDAAMEQWTADVRELKADVEKWEQSRSGHELEQDSRSNSNGTESLDANGAAQTTFSASPIAISGDLSQPNRN